jgi:hypothetical protein
MLRLHQKFTCSVQFFGEIVPQNVIRFSKMISRSIKNLMTSILYSKGKK